MNNNNNSGYSKFIIDNKLNKEIYIKSVHHDGLLPVNSKKFDYLCSIHHINISNLNEYNETKNDIYLSTPKYRGGSLRDAINNANKTIGFSENVILSWLLNILEGLEYLHIHNILHLNLKPENILLTLQDIAVIDINPSISSILHHCNNNNNKFKYTIINIHNFLSQYSPPELLMNVNDYSISEIEKLINDDIINESCDLYSVGIIIYELCCFEIPKLLKKEECQLPIRYSTELNDLVIKLIFDRENTTIKDIMESDIIQNHIKELNHLFREPLNEFKNELDIPVNSIH